MAGKKKGNNNKQNHSGGKHNNKKAEREMRTFHKRKRDRVKYGGDQWCAEYKKLNDQLMPLGLTIRDVQGDGNCLFRAIADQLENNANKWNDYRSAIVTYMENNRDAFEPFLDAEDDGTFEEYARSMRENGTWGGNLEIQAASLLYKINIIIYQLDQPRWEVVNFADVKTRTIQLSYLDGDHYASVIPINATTAVAPHATTIPAHLTSPAVKAPKKEHYIEPPNDFEKIVMESSGNHDINVVRKALEEHDWDSDATIAYLMTISGTHSDEIPVIYEVEGDQQVPLSPSSSSSYSSISSISSNNSSVSSNNSYPSSITSTSMDEPVEEGHLHKAIRIMRSNLQTMLSFLYLLFFSFSFFSKVSKHIPHHPHLHHGKESRKERRKNRKAAISNNNNNNNNSNNIAYNIQEPISTQNAIREMGALSI